MNIALRTHKEIHTFLLVETFMRKRNMVEGWYTGSRLVIK